MSKTLPSNPNINFLRKEAKKLLLRNNDLLIKDITHSVGYFNELSFSRSFKKSTGITPGQYRSEKSKK